MVGTIETCTSAKKYKESFEKEKKSVPTGIQRYYFQSNSSSIQGKIVL